MSSLPNKIRRILTLPLRRWRSGGFGIHSPLAYSLVTQTLADRSEYYCYEPLRREAGARFRRLSLVVRLVVRLQPETVAVVGGDPLIVRAVQMADSRAAIVGADAPAADLVIVAPGAAPGRLPDAPCYLVYDIDGANAPAWDALTARSSGLMDFTDLRDGVACLRRDLPRQTFKVIFR